MFERLERKRIDTLDGAVLQDLIGLLSRSQVRKIRVGVDLVNDLNEAVLGHHLASQELERLRRALRVVVFLGDLRRDHILRQR